MEIQNNGKWETHSFGRKKRNDGMKERREIRKKGGSKEWIKGGRKEKNNEEKRENYKEEREKEKGREGDVAVSNMSLRNQLEYCVSLSFCIMNKGFPNDIVLVPRGRRPR